MVKLSSIKVNPKNPRIIKDEKFKQLVKSLQDFPQMMELRPIIVDDNNIILGGNMRYKALLELGKKEVPNEWIKKVKDLTEEQKKQFLIKDNIAFGEWQYDLLANEWDTNELMEWGLELPDFSSEVDDNNYSRKIEVPIYEPSNKKPESLTLVDRIKTETLLNEIENSNISQEDKDFLKLAAQRHLVFNYSRIADYYANSTKEVQALMEKSALIIIDFNKAIEYGFIKMTKEISELFCEDYDA